MSAFALSKEQRALIVDACPGCEFYDPTDVAGPEVARDIFNPEIIGPHLGDCDAIVAYTIPRDLVKRAPRLRWLHCMAAGLDYVLKTGMFDHGEIVLTNTSGASAAMIGEYILMSMLLYSHQHHISLRAQVRHQWTPITRFFSQADSLRGKALGIIGYGAIGREAARLAAGFGVEVMALKRDPHVRRDPRFSFPGIGDPEGLIPTRWFGPEHCAELMALNDFVVVTLPLTSATRNFIGARELGAARPGAYLINVGRGEVIDQPALIQALTSGLLGGAGLDVMVPEPLPHDHPLWDMENVILTPHTAGPNKRYQDDCIRIFVENLRRFASGRELINVVDVKRGY
ncbi:MAG: D-2-hydroxyacid dehydrogenase [Candidatus Binataceae bacterium]